MNRESILTLLLLIGLFGLRPVQGQEIRGLSPSIQMDFGYPELQVLEGVEFVDENDDNILSAGEAMLISFSIKNIGEYPAVKVKIRLKELNQVPGLDLSEDVEVGGIAPGETKLVQIGISSDKSLTKGTASLVFEILENERFQNLSVPYVVNTQP